MLLSRAIGQTLLMGWDGTEVTPQIRSLIEDHHLGSIILTAKNLKCSVLSFPFLTSFQPLKIADPVQEGVAEEICRHWAPID